MERALHIAFAPNRVNPKREFFQIDPGQAIAILKLLHTEDATAEIAIQPVGLAPSEVAAAEQFRARRPRLNFEEMGIPTGAQLTWTSLPGASVTVTGPRKVRLGMEEMSLSAATQNILSLGYPVAPGGYWQYEGRLLRDIYNETYPLAEEGT